MWPPSLRLYALAKRIPGVLADVLDEDGQLVADVMCYASEESAAEQEEAERRRLDEARRARR